MPPAIKVEEALALPDIDDLWFQQAKRHQAALRTTPAAINGAAQLYPLRHITRGTKPSRTLQTSRGPQSIHVELGRVGRRKERNVKWICTPAFGDKLAGSVPGQERSPATTDVERPRVQHGNHRVEQSPTQDDYPEQTCERAASLLHAPSISYERFGVPASAFHFSAAGAGKAGTGIHELNPDLRPSRGSMMSDSLFRSNSRFWRPG